MNTKKSFHIKSIVILVILGFGLFSFGSLLFTFIKSSKMDIEHVEITEITEKVQIDILLSMIAMDEFNIVEDTSFLSDISKNLKNAEDHLSSINNKIRSPILRNIKNSRDDFIRKNTEIRDQIKILERLTTKDKLINSRYDNTNIKQAYYDFNKSFGEFEAKLHNYIILSNSNFKKELQIILISSFLVLVLCIHIIIKQINTMSLADLLIINKTIEIEQKERHRIAMDLHDGIGSLLSSIGLYIKLLQAEKFTNKGVGKKMDQLRQLSDLAYNSFEEVIDNLYPASLKKYGLVKQLEDLLNKINNTGEVYYELQVENLHLRLPPTTEVILYRICNELINNTLKHSGAKSSKIVLSNMGNKISLHYTDDGIGFNPELDYYQTEGKTGLKNLISRIESLGGTSKMKSNPDQGVDFYIQFRLS